MVPWSMCSLGSSSKSGKRLDGYCLNCHYHCKSCISLISIAFLVRFDSLHSHRLCRPHHRHSMLLSGATFLYSCDDHSHFSQAVWCDLEVSLISQHVFCLKTYHQIIRKFTSWWLNRCQKCQASVQDVQASLKKGVLFDMSWTIDNGKSSISHSPKLFKLSFDDVLSASAGLPPLRRIHVQHPEHQQDFQ